MIGELGLPDDQRSSPEVEARRLAGCRDCEYLSGYGTCLMCGCLVRVRAVHAAARCPHPIQGRWQAGG